MATAAYVINRLPQPRLGFVSPYEKLFGGKSTVKHIRVFGCVCYVFVTKNLQTKLDKRAVRCIFVGYDNRVKGWRCCDPSIGKIYVSRDVIFDEALSWWSNENVVLPDSLELEDEVQNHLNGEESRQGNVDQFQIGSSSQEVQSDESNSSKGGDFWATK